MSRKHFERIARILNWRKEMCESLSAEVAVQRTAEELADYFEEENPRFNREKFLTACGF